MLELLPQTVMDMKKELVVPLVEGRHLNFVLSGQMKKEMRMGDEGCES